MTLPGGAANKLGNRYEKWWTLSEFVRMLRSDTEAIRIEAPGVDKAEFVVTAAAHRERHQARRSHQNGKWSLAALRGDGLLEAIGRYLAGNNDRFVFASGSNARALADLCESARPRGVAGGIRAPLPGGQRAKGQFSDTAPLLGVRRSGRD